MKLYAFLIVGRRGCLYVGLCGGLTIYVRIFEWD